MAKRKSVNRTLTLRMQSFPTYRQIMFEKCVIVDDFLELELHFSREMATQVEAVSLVAVNKGGGLECPSEREAYTSSALQTGARVLDIS